MQDVSLHIVNNSLTVAIKTADTTVGISGADDLNLALKNQNETIEIDNKELSVRMLNPDTTINLKEIEMTVITLNVPSIGLSDPDDACVTGPSMEFSATPAGGVFTSNAPAGFVDNGDGTATLDVAAAGVGDYEVTYTIPLCGDGTAHKTVSFSVVNCGIDISGKIIWEPSRLSTMTGVNAVTCVLSGDDTDTDDTDNSGLYSFLTVVGSDFVITPTKNRSIANGAMSGVTAADSSRIQQHISGALPLTDPYKLIAADINNSKSVTSQDASFIQQALVGNPIAQSFFINRTWVFVPKDYVFANPLNPWQGGSPWFPQSITLTGVTTNQTNQDFIGIKLGDVNGSANPALMSAGSDIASLRTKDRKLKKGQSVDADFTIRDFKGLLALQFCMRHDGLELTSLEAGDGPMKAEHLGRYNPGEIRGVLPFLEATDINPKQILFTAKFTATKDGRLSNFLSFDFALSPSVFRTNYTSGPLALEVE